MFLRRENNMQTLSLIWGILAVLGMVVGLIPLLGWWNWINIPFSGLGLLVSIIAWATAGDKPRNSSIAGLACCIGAVFFGYIRLSLGGGIF